MKTAELLNYARDQWICGTGARADIASAIDGSLVATTGSGGLDFGAMLTHAREVGGPALRKLTFHDRARIIKGLGLAILARKEELYELNYLTGATRKDGKCARGKDRVAGDRGHRHARITRHTRFGATPRSRQHGRACFGIRLWHGGRGCIDPARRVAGEWP